MRTATGTGARDRRRGPPWRDPLSSADAMSVKMQLKFDQVSHDIATMLEAIFECGALANEY